MGGGLMIRLLLLIIIWHLSPLLAGLVQLSNLQPQGKSTPVTSLLRCDHLEDCQPAFACLPCDEVKAANNLVTALGASVLQGSISRSDCGSASNPVSFQCGCEFSGVLECHIITIATANTVKLSGKIPKDVANFTYLQTLDLSNNALNGSIPDSLGSLSNLQYLDLQKNQFTGKIPPSLGSLTNLKYLDLGYNYLNGTISKSLGNLSSLEALVLRFNNLNGEIPPHLGNLTNLTALGLTENQLSGSLPESFEKLTKLEYFYLTSNKFTGEIPKGYENLKSLRVFDVAGNSLAGPIPSFISKWTNLTNLNLFGNEFDEIPQEIFNMPNLRRLLISDVHRKEAPLPKSINLPNIVSIVLRSCSINDISSITKIKSLLYLDLSFNKLTGDIPSSTLWHLLPTKYNNSYRDVAIAAILSQPTIRMLLTGNQLSGKVPPELLKDNSTLTGDFTYNNFTITDEFKRRVNRQTYFHPTSSEMSEQCPTKKKKYELFLNCGGSAEDINGRRYEADNSTSNFHVSSGSWAYSCAGDYPAEATETSDLIQTKACAAPVTNAPLYTKTRQCPISLRYYAFCLRKGKYTVKLHFIETDFTETADYTILGKRVFDIHVQGKLVSKDFNIREKADPETSISIVTLNDTAVDDSGLLEIHFYWAGKGSYVPPTYSNGPLVAAIEVTPNFHIGLRVWQKIAIGVGSGLLLLFLLLLVLWWTGVIGDKKLREKSIDIRGKRYTVKQVVQGTKKFSTKTEIGTGGFGTVYKSELPSGGPVVAVKKLSPHSHQKKQQVQSEVYTLKQLKHDNIVELFDGYSDPTRNLHLLVYEYMEHKSIAHVLFDPNSELQLNWAARYNICIGMAKGLEYLHNSRFKIVHRNIKSTNILLDEHNKAKISDLGLAKLFEEENPYVTIGSKSNMYRAPEYATRNAITDKADVYSFGVVLLEIVSGKNNADYKDAQEAEFLLDKAFVLQSKGKLWDLVDGKLFSDQTYKRNQAIKVLELAMMCLDQSHKLRPSMSQVVDVLEDRISIQQLSKQINPST